MKKILLTAVLTLIGIYTATAQVGIGTTSPDASAQLELQSTAKGFLPPRMDSDARDDISSPAQGLMIYCTNCGANGEAQVYNGTEWTNMTGGSASAGLYVPDAPTIDGVTSGDGQVDVAFKAPADDGGSAITSYTATSDPDAITGTLSQAGDGSITVSGLTNGVDYTFTVTATNAIGTSAASATSATVTPAAPPQVGDYRYGGVVFYVAPEPTDLNGDGTLDQGLVCAVEDLATAHWGCRGTSISGAGGTAIGTGADNTSAISADCTESGLAAKLCQDYAGGGYSDWFLPSEEELNLMYQKKEDIDDTATASGNGGSSFVSVKYWSSTELDINHALEQSFGSNFFTGLGGKQEDYKARVRAVRAF